MGNAVASIDGLLRFEQLQTMLDGGTHRSITFWRQHWRDPVLSIDEICHCFNRAKGYNADLNPLRRKRISVEFIL